MPTSDAGWVPTAVRTASRTSALWLKTTTGAALLTGGFGNAIGVAIGAFIFGMTSLGIIYAGWDPNWFKAFLGVMLLLAVLVNLYVKRMATARKVG